MASGGDAALASPDQLPPPAAGVLRVAVDLDEVRTCDCMNAGPPP